MGKVFVDTNVLVYCADHHDPAKQRVCRALVGRLQAEGRAVVSTQVLQELYSACTRKLAIAPLAAKGILQGLREVETVVADRPLIDDAIDCSILDQISFWDALIVAGAAAARCEVLLTEDLNHGQMIRGVRIQDPLRYEQ